VALARPVVFAHQAAQGDADVVAEAAALRVGPAEVGAEKTEGEFLGQLGGGVHVAQGAEQVAVDRPPVAPHEGVLGGGRPVRPARVGLEDQRPDGRDAAQPLVRRLAFHRRPSDAPGATRRRARL
jgi:hypothetical protein